MCKGPFVVHDMRMFVLSILSSIGWLVFTIGFAVLINNNPRYFGSLDDTPTFNALTAVHFILAIAGCVILVHAELDVLRNVWFWLLFELCQCAVSIGLPQVCCLFILVKI